MTITTARSLLATLLLGVVAGAAPAQSHPVRGHVPVREVTVFKDGHAYVVHRGRVATDSVGHVVLDELPAPVLGTFWPFCAEKGATLRGVVAGVRPVREQRTARDVADLVCANPGADVIVTENGRSYSARIVSVPEPGEDEEKPARDEARLVLLETADGVRAVPLSAVQDITFKGDFETRRSIRAERKRLTLRLDWGGREAGAAAEVGMMYVQKGLRWIPSYRVDIDGKGVARLALEATLVNELCDLDEVTVNLVIGVPRFAFEETLDPVALQEAAAKLSPYFENNSQTAYALSNAIMTQHAMPQSARMGGVRGRNGSTDDPAGMKRVAEGGKNEDLFVFTVKGVTLARGERMVVPVTEFSLSYEDVHTLDVPMAPPQEMLRQFNDQRSAQIATLYHAPKVQHALRLSNTSSLPLTTAPALILADGRVLAQGMMTYTAPGGRVDLPVTTAVDVRVARRDVETGREPSATSWRGHSYMKIGLGGTIELENNGAGPITVEVSRHVLGNVDAARPDGASAQVSAAMVPGSLVGHLGGVPNWWRWYSWPWWWGHFNGIGEVRWTVTLQPGASQTLAVDWHYFWR